MPPSSNACDDPNRPEWRGKRKPKNYARNYARNYAACKGNKISDGKPPAPCLKCGMVHKMNECPVCGCPRVARGKR